MNRIEQNAKMIEELNSSFEKVANGKLPCITREAILAVLVDASKSLAIIADSMDEDGRRQGVAIDGNKRYWKGYHAAQEDGKKIYQKGYEDGARCQDEVQYQKGLNDAWDAVRKLDDSLTYDELYNIFDANCYRILDRFSASEVIEKIRAYEEKQKDKIDIKVGTKVRTTKDYDHYDAKVFPTGTVGTVTEIDLECEHPYIVSANGDYWYYAADMFEVIEEDEKQKRDCDNDKEWDSDSEACANSPCDLCRFNPPSAGDGKPCTMCPAEGKVEE